jgi:hypothetical protein
LTIGLSHGLLKKCSFDNGNFRSPVIITLPVANRESGGSFARSPTARLHPVIDTSFHLGELSAALAHLERQAHFGKVTISFADA